MADIVKLIYKGDEMAQGGGSGSTPQATTSTIGTVRVATYAEAKAGTQTGSNGEYLMVPNSYIHDNGIYYYGSEDVSQTATEKGQEVTMTFPYKLRRGFVPIRWRHQVINGVEVNTLHVSGGGSTYKVAGTTRNANSGDNFIEDVTELYYVHGGSSEQFTVTLTMGTGNYMFADTDTKARKFIAGNWFPVTFYEDSN